MSTGLTRTSSVRSRLLFFSCIPPAFRLHSTCFSASSSLCTEKGQRPKKIAKSNERTIERRNYLE